MLIDGLDSETGCDGFMSGQGLQCNPAMFRPSLTASIISDKTLIASSSSVSSLERRTVRSLKWRASPNLLYPSSSSSSSTSPSSSMCNCTTRRDAIGTACTCMMAERFSVASSYLECCITWRPSCAAIVRHHLYWMLLPVIQHHSDLYDTLFSATHLYDHHHYTHRMHHYLEFHVSYAYAALYTYIGV